MKLTLAAAALGLAVPVASQTIVQEYTNNAFYADGEREPLFLPIMLAPPGPTRSQIRPPANIPPNLPRPHSPARRLLGHDAAGPWHIPS
jgi:hypothetical protein